MDGNSYKFVTNEDVTISPENGVYKFSNIEIFEGTLSSFNYTYLSEDTDFRFVLPNADMDTSTLTVQVQESVADTTTTTYTLANNYENINGESTVFSYKKLKLVNLKYILETVFLVKHYQMEILLGQNI